VKTTICRPAVAVAAIQAAVQAADVAVTHGRRSIKGARLAVVAHADQA